MGLDQDEAQLTILDSILGTLTPHTPYIHQPLSCSDKKKQGPLDGSLNYIINTYRKINLFPPVSTQYYPDLRL